MQKEWELLPEWAGHPCLREEGGFAWPLSGYRGNNSTFSIVSEGNIHTLLGLLKTNDWVFGKSEPISGY